MNQYNMPRSALFTALTLVAGRVGAQTAATADTKTKTTSTTAEAGLPRVST